MQDRTIAIVPQRTTGIAQLTLHPAKPRRKHFLVDTGHKNTSPRTRRRGSGEVGGDEKDKGGDGLLRPSP